MIQKILSYLLLAFFLNACAVAIPVHQVNGPQSLGKYALDISVYSGTSPAVGPEFEDDSGLQASVDELLGELNLTAGYHLGFGITENLDIELETLVGVPSGGIVIGALKYQWLGNSLFKSSKGWNSAVRVRYISASGFEDEDTETTDGDTLFDNTFIEKMDATGFSVANSFGYSVTDWFQPYFGFQYISSTLEYRYREDDANGQLFEGDRDISGYGALAGLQFNTTGQSFRFAYIMEYQYTNLPGTHSDTTIWYDSFFSTLTFAFQF